MGIHLHKVSGNYRQVNIGRGGGGGGGGGEEGK